MCSTHGTDYTYGTLTKNTLTKSIEEKLTEKHRESKTCSCFQKGWRSQSHF